MAIAPCGALVKAAHEPRPANGLSGAPSTCTLTSLRAQPMRTTPSGVTVALAPEAAAIRSASSLSSRGAKAASSITNAAATIPVAPSNSLTRIIIGHSLPGLRGRSFPREREIVELRLGVGLRPHPNLAGIREGRVMYVQVLLAIQVAFDVVALHR